MDMWQGIMCMNAFSILIIVLLVFGEICMKAFFVGCETLQAWRMTAFEKQHVDQVSWNHKFQLSCYPILPYRHSILIHCIFFLGGFSFATRKKSEKKINLLQSCEFDVCSVKAQRLSMHNNPVPLAAGKKKWVIWSTLETWLADISLYREGGN